MKKQLFIDLGHSAKFPGAAGEVEHIRKIWECLQKEIRTSDFKRKWDVLLVPDSFPNDKTSNGNLINRIKWINERAVDGAWLISIHGNSASNTRVKGVTTCFMGGSSYMAEKAKSLSKAVAYTCGMKVWNGGSFDDRTGRFGRIGMVRDTKPMALLIETGFCSNPQDMAVPKLEIARAIADWLETEKL
jgi:N-acetylmuramoyl-L-alanine amidase